MNAKKLGSNIQKYRKEKGFTQDVAAEKCGLSTNYFRQIELGHKVPKLETFLKIADVLEVSTDLLLTGNYGFATKTKTNEIYNKVKDLPTAKQEFILNTVDSMVEDIKKI